MMSLSVERRNLLTISGYCRTESNDMNVIDGIILIIIEYYKSAKWSRIHKGQGIELSEDDSKATCIDYTVDQDPDDDTISGSVRGVH